MYFMSCFVVLGEGIPEPKGSELSGALVFAEKYNMTAVLVVNPEDYWGEIFDNWTGKGLFGNLISDKADIGFGKFE